MAKPLDQLSRAELDNFPKERYSVYCLQGPYENTTTLTSKRSVDFIVRSRLFLIVPMEHNGIQACFD